MVKSKILSAIADADQSDLDELSQEIQRAEAEFEAEVSRLRGHIDSLKAAHKLIDVKLNGKKPRAEPQRKTAKPDSTQVSEASSVESLADKIYDLITREGSLPPNVIASMLGRSVQGVNMAITKSGWFTRGADGEIRIAKTG